MKTFDVICFLLPFVLSGCNSGGSGETSASAIQGALASAEKEFPKTLAETNLFLDVAKVKPTEVVVPFKVKVPLWSDGAEKNRFIFVPPGQKLSHLRETGAFNYPVGTTLVKHFTTDTVPPENIETRVMTKKDDGNWKFVTYVWNDNGIAEANLRPRKVTKGGKEYRIPSEQECQMCHGEGEKANVLGFTTKQINFETDVALNQIDALEQYGFFEQTANELKSQKALDNPKDSLLSINARARSYMDVNCGVCHNPDGPEKANLLDMRLDAIDTKLVAEEKIIPGKPADSLLWKLISAETERMPLISLRPDPEGVEVMRQYIEAWPQ